MVNPAFVHPSRWLVSNSLMASEYWRQETVVDRIVDLSCASGDLVVGRDGFSDRKNASIESVLLYTPVSLYIYTELWREQHHTDVHTFKFFAKQIDKLGSRDISVFVSDTEPKMQSVWTRLQEECLWTTVIPCAAHVLDLSFTDISKHAVVFRRLQVLRHPLAVLPRPPLLKSCPQAHPEARPPERAPAPSDRNNAVEVGAARGRCGSQDPNGFLENCLERRLQESGEKRRRPAHATSSC